MEKFLWIFGSVWILLAFLFVFAIAAAARKRVLSEKDVIETVRVRQPSRKISPARPAIHSAQVPESARA